MIRARELFLIIRAQNQASNSLRRVSKDVRSLGGATGVQDRVQRLKFAGDTLRAQKSLAQEELSSINSGKRKLAQQRAYLDLQKNVRNTMRDIANIEIRNNALNASRLREEVTLSRLRGKRNRDASTGQFTTRDPNIAKLIQASQIKLDNVVLKQQQLRRAALSATDALGRQVGRLKELEVQEAAAGRRADYLRSRISSLNDRLARNAKLVDDIRWQNFDAGARTVSHLGRVLQLAGLVGTASLGMMAKGAADLQTQVTLAATQARPLGQGLASTAKISSDFMKVVLKQMDQFPASSQQMSDSLYEIFSGTNATRKEGEALLTTFNKMAVAGGTDLSVMTDAGISMFNNFRDEFKNMDEAANAFFATVRFARTTPAQLAGSLSTILPIAKEAGLRFKDISNALGILTRQTGGQRIRQDATGLARLIELFARPDVAQGLRKYGVEVSTVDGKMRPLLNIIQDIQKQIKIRPGLDAINFFKNITEGISGSRGTQGTIQARRVFAFLITNAKEYQRVAKLINADNNEFAQSFLAMSKSPGVRWQILTNQLKAFAITLGEDALPTIIAIAEPLVQMFRAFNHLSPEVKKAVAVFLVIASVGVLVIGTLAAIAGSLATMYISFRLFKGIIGSRGAAGDLVTFEKNAGKLGASLLGALKGTKGFADEAGAVRVGVLGMVAAVAVAIPLIPKLTGGVLDLHDAFQLLEFALEILTVKWGLNKLGYFTKDLALANKGSLLFLARLSRIAKIGVITVGLNLILNGGNRYNKNDQWNLKGIKEAINPLNFGRDIQAAFGMHDKRQGMSLDNMTLNQAKDQSESLIKTYGREAWQKRIDELEKQQHDIDKANARLVAHKEDFIRTVISGVIEPFAPQFALQQLDKMDQALAARKRLVSRLTSIDPKAPTDPRKWAVAGFSDAQFLDRLRKVDGLQRAFEKTPNMGTWRAYHHAMDALTAKSTDEQKKMINDLLGTFEKVPKFTDSQFQKAQKNLEALQKAATKSGTFEAGKKAAVAEAKLRDKATDAQIAAIDYVHQYQAEVDRKAEEAKQKAEQIAEDLEAKRIARMKQNVENARSAIESSTSTLLAFYNNALSENKGMFGELFQGPFMNSAVMQNRQQFGFSARPKDLIRDLHMQVTRFQRFQGSLSKLRGRGAPAELVDQIRSLGPEAQKQLDMINKFTPGQFKKYVDEFKKGQKLIELTTKKDLDRQVQRWMKFGKRVALAIIRGISSETPAMEKALEARILRMFPGLANQAQVRPTGPIPALSGSFRSNILKPTPAGTTVHHKEVHYHLPESLKNGSIFAQLKASYFHERTRDS